MSIPKIIHQTYSSCDIPEDLYPIRWRESWKNKNPNWEYRFWTDRDNRNLIEQCYPWFLKTYDAYPYEIQRVDAWRYFVLHKYGGLYVDLDFECFKPVDAVFQGEELVLSSRSTKDSVSNAIMASQPNHLFWEAVWISLEQEKKLSLWKRIKLAKYRSVKNQYVLHSTGPSMLSKVYQQYSKENIKVLPKKFFWELNVFEYREAQGHQYSSDSYAAHHYVSSWAD